MRCSRDPVSARRRPKPVACGAERVRKEIFLWPRVPSQYGAQILLDVFGVETVRAARAVGEPVLQGQAHRAEGNVLPWNLRFFEQRYFQAFIARLELEIEQARPVEHVDLVDVRDRNHAEGRRELHARAGFLEGLARRALRGGFAVFHEAGRQRPVAVARLDGAPAQENPVLPLRQAADHQPGVLVMDAAAGVAEIARQRIARRHPLGQRCRAARAKLHLRSRIFRGFLVSMVNSRATMNTKLGEWMWRFLAIVMMFSVGWTVWIIYQLNPPPLVMNAAFEAAAKAKGKGPGEKQSAQGVIAPSAAPQAPAPSG